MPIGFTNSGIDARAPKHFRCTVAMSTFNTSADAQGGGCTPNGNFPTTNKYFYSTNLTGSKSTTRATTDALALRRERGLMRWESVVRALNEKSNCEIFDIEIVEANGDAQATQIQWTVAYEDTDSLFDKDATSFTSIDGSTTVNTAEEVIKEQIVRGLNFGATYTDDSTLTGSNTELRTVYRPATTDAVVQSVSVSPPADTETIFAATTVAQITTTKLVSGEDS